MEWMTNIVNLFMQLFSSFGPMLSRMFGGQTAQAAPAPPATPQQTPAAVPQNNTNQPAPPQQTPRAVPLSNTNQPAPQPAAPQLAAPQLAAPLSYATKNSATEWLNPADYQGRIKIPDSIKQAEGSKGVYAMITIQAGQRADGYPYAKGFHVFEKDGKQTLIPFISGGSTKVAVTDFSNSDAVESATNAPLPGLVTDMSGKKGDGIHVKRTITTWENTPLTNELGTFDFFLEYEDGKSSRAAIGAHNDLLEAGENPLKPKGSKGCPVVHANDVEKFKQAAQNFGLRKGSTYYILDPHETLQPPQGVTVATNQSPLSTPSTGSTPRQTSRT